VLYKLSLLSYQHKSINKHMDCLVLGRFMLTAIFRLSMPHP